MYGANLKKDNGTEIMEREVFTDTSVQKKEGFIRTGIDKLDRLLEGGIPNGFTVVLLGSPGSSTEILVKQIAIGGIVTYITTEETKMKFSILCADSIGQFQK